MTTHHTHAYLAALTLAVMLALTLTACGTKTIIVSSPLPQATVTVTPDSTPTPTTAPAATLDMDAAEQASYDFICSKYDRVVAINERLFDAIDNRSNAKCASAILEAADEYVPIRKQWNRLDWGYGAVSDLEDDFEIYMSATTRFLRAWIRGVYGGGDVNTCVSEQMKACQRIESYGPRVEQHLAELKGDTY